jgi:hypothetical protein
MRVVSEIDAPRLTLAGLAASVAYLIANEIDVRVANYPQRDLMLQGRMLPGVGRAWPLLGLLMHTGFGLSLAVIYATVVRDRLPGPYWLRGVIWLNVENLLLWPLTLRLDRQHPAVLDGSMPPLANWRCFGQAVFRHTVFGAVLGWLYGDAGHRPPDASEPRS